MVATFRKSAFLTSVPDMRNHASKKGTSKPPGEVMILTSLSTRSLGDIQPEPSGTRMPISLRRISDAMAFTLSPCLERPTDMALWLAWPISWLSAATICVVLTEPAPGSKVTRTPSSAYQPFFSARKYQEWIRIGVHSSRIFKSACAGMLASPTAPASTAPATPVHNRFTFMTTSLR